MTIKKKKRHLDAPRQTKHLSPFCDYIIIKPATNELLSPIIFTNPYKNEHGRVLPDNFQAASTLANKLGGVVASRKAILAKFGSLKG